jgi:hypothetical protein
VETRRITLVAQAKDGKITVSAEIPVSGGTDTYLITIDITPQPPAETASRALDALYGALADTPLPEIIEDRYPEIRDEL